MTPPEDRGPYGIPYPGTGHDAFAASGAGHGQSYGQDYAGSAGLGYSTQPQQMPYAQGQFAQQPYAGQAQAAQQPASGGYQGYPGPEAFPEQTGPYHADEPEDDHDSGPLIRPFAMTGGRTRPRYELALEALVSASVDPVRLATLLPEHQRICTLCTEVKSVAEVSALLSLPLGVARILVADLAEAGLVTIHQPAAGGESGNQPDVTLLERVLSGLRKL